MTVSKTTAIKKTLCIALLMTGLLTGLLAGLDTAAARAARDNDYPTVAIADYVFACMATNGQTRKALEQCSCSIDVIASLMTFQDYEAAETIIRLRAIAGEKSAPFRSGEKMKSAFARIKRAQVEAEIRCFYP